MARPAELGGILAAIPTPFDANEDLALDALRSNLERWNKSRLQGYTVLGTTGELVSLATEEKKRVLAAAREAIPANRTFVAGTGAESTRETVTNTRDAAEAGADYAIVVTPHYNRFGFSDGALDAHYRRVADESPIPVLLYHIPACTGLALPPETVARIAEHPNVAGIKDSSGDVLALQETRRLAPRGFRVLTGSASGLLAAVTVGADGAILADACVAPDLCIDVFEAARAGDLDRARLLQDRLAALSAILIGVYGVSGVKALLDRIGFYGGPSRSPLSTPTEAAKALVAALRASRQETLSP